jgi:hypothetical protein
MVFDRIKKVFGKPGGESRPSEAASSRFPDSPVSEWAATQGLVFSADQAGSVALEGSVHGKRWRLERGRPTRDYIVGEELRARAQLDLNEDIAVMVMNRALSDRLEHKAYERSTDHLQTSIDGNLPQEVRWLAMYEETAWPALPVAFWNRYSVYTDRPEVATGWIDARLAQLMLQWPQPAPSEQVPFMLLLMRGKAYLRMEYRPADLPILQHAALIFTSACESALNASIDLALD